MDLLEVFGIAVLDHSRLDHCVLGSHEDCVELNRIIGIVPLKAKRGDPGSKNDLRDGMHIHTAIRDGYDGFVTTDRRVLRAAGAVRAGWPMFGIFTPSEAVAWVRKELRASTVGPSGRLLDDPRTSEPSDGFELLARRTP
jgi:hypothetical protein